ncbi:MAG: CDF family Co(II)/Ni(II) efflux transporter DmeF [Methylococcaceae bacterium]|nr:CDF family Co(II)/Ni(II) efflux transporter DmeF [Methylococcaceae bacterium]
MHTDTLNLLQHDHDYTVINRKGERRTKQVLVLTFLTMLLEIVAGIVFGSMALLADGWHMGTHVAAFMIAIYAYRYSRIHANDHTFAFSSGKVGVLGGFASSVALGVVALMMSAESIERLVKPHSIQFDDAIAVAGFGLAINLISALLLKDDHHHHDHSHEVSHTHKHKGDTKNKHTHHHHDHNLKAAYFHVLADALTSVLAIIALVLGKYYGWNWLDPVMGIVGALVITRWSYLLLKETSPVLLDESIELKYKLAVREIIERDADNRISDLHIWRIAPDHFAIIISLVSHTPQTPEYYKGLLKEFYSRSGVNVFSHVTIEVNQCHEMDCMTTTIK